MRRLRVKIDDPDGFFHKTRQFGYVEPHCYYPIFLTILKEDELPPRFPTFTYEDDIQ